MAFVVAGLGVEHDDAAIAVAVRDVKLARGIVGDHVRRPAELGLAVGAARRAGLADLLQELAVGRELQDLVIALVVAGDPDVPALST